MSLDNCFESCTLSAFGTVTISSTGGAITQFLLQDGVSSESTINDFPQGGNVCLTFATPVGPCITDWSSKIESHWASASGPNTFTYYNGFKIIESSTMVQIIYAGNIVIDADINIPGKTLVIMSWNCNVTINSGVTLTASTVNLFAKNGTVTTTGATITATHTNIFDQNVSSISGVPAVTCSTATSCTSPNFIANTWTCNGPINLTSDITVSAGAIIITPCDLNAKNIISSGDLTLIVGGNLTSGSLVTSTNGGNITITVGGNVNVAGYSIPLSNNPNNENNQGGWAGIGGQGGLNALSAGISPGVITLTVGGNINVTGGSASSSKENYGGAGSGIGGGGGGGGSAPPGGQGGNSGLITLTAGGNINVAGGFSNNSSNNLVGAGSGIGGGGGGIGNIGGNASGTIILTAGHNINVLGGSTAAQGVNSGAAGSGIGGGGGKFGGNASGMITLTAGGNTHIMGGSATASTSNFGGAGSGIGGGGGNSSGGTTTAMVTLIAFGSVYVISGTGFGSPRDGQEALYAVVLIDCCNGQFATASQTDGSQTMSLNLVTVEYYGNTLFDFIEVDGVLTAFSCCSGNAFILSSTGNEYILYGFEDGSSTTFSTPPQHFGSGETFEGFLCCDNNVFVVTKSSTTFVLHSFNGNSGAPLYIAQNFGSSSATFVNLFCCIGSIVGIATQQNNIAYLYSVDGSTGTFFPENNVTFSYLQIGVSTIQMTLAWNTSSPALYDVYWTGPTTGSALSQSGETFTTPDLTFGTYYVEVKVCGQTIMAFYPVMSIYASAQASSCSSSTTAINFSQNPFVVTIPEGPSTYQLVLNISGENPIIEFKSQSGAFAPQSMVKGNTVTLTWNNLPTGIYTVSIFASLVPKTFSTVQPIEYDQNGNIIHASVSAPSADTSTGQLTLNTVGGVLPYTYNLIGGGSSPSLSNMTLGQIYSIQVKDSSGYLLPLTTAMACCTNTDVFYQDAHQHWYLYQFNLNGAPIVKYFYQNLLNKGSALTAACCTAQGTNGILVNDPGQFVLNLYDAITGAFITSVLVGDPGSSYGAMLTQDNYIYVILTNALCQTILYTINATTGVIINQVNVGSPCCTSTVEATILNGNVVIVLCCNGTCHTFVFSASGVSATKVFDFWDLILFEKRKKKQKHRFLKKPSKKILHKKRHCKN